MVGTAVLARVDVETVVFDPVVFAEGTVVVMVVVGKVVVVGGGTVVGGSYDATTNVSILCDTFGLVKLY